MSCHVSVLAFAIICYYLLSCAIICYHLLSPIFHRFSLFLTFLFWYSCSAWYFFLPAYQNLFFSPLYFAFFSQPFFFFSYLVLFFPLLFYVFALPLPVDFFSFISSTEFKASFLHLFSFQLSRDLPFLYHCLSQYFSEIICTFSVSVSVSLTTQALSLSFTLFSRVNATLQHALSVGRLVGQSVTFYFFYDFISLTPLTPLPAQMV